MRIPKMSFFSGLARAVGDSQENGGNAVKDSFKSIGNTAESTIGSAATIANKGWAFNENGSQKNDFNTEPKNEETPVSQDSAIDISTFSGKNFHIEAEVFGGCSDRGETLSFEDCLNDVQYDYADNMLDGKIVCICNEANEPVTGCFITEDNKLRLDFVEQNKEQIIPFDEEVADYIQGVKNSREKERLVSAPTKEMDSLDDLSLE